MAEHDDDNDEKSSSSSDSKIPLFTVISRVVTLASLLISSVVVYTNEITDGNNNGVINYKSYESYRYAFGIMIAGICYTVVLVPFAGYYLVAKKQLLDHPMFHLFQLVGDKILIGLLATAAGASLATTVELQKSGFADGMTDKMHSFFGLMHIPNAFLVLALIGSLISSILSSLNHQKSE